MSAQRSPSSASSVSPQSSGRRSPSIMQPRLRTIRPRTAPPIFDEPRRRAISEAVPSLAHGRWRIVGAWSSLRKGSSTEDSQELKDHQKDPQQNEKRNSTRPRKRVSLFLRRKKKKSIDNNQDEHVPQKHHHLHFPFGSAATDDHDDDVNDDDARPDDENNDQNSCPDLDEGKHHQFQRAQSHLIKPVGKMPAHGRGEAARYLQYAADIDEDSFDRLKDLALEARSSSRVALVVDDEPSTDEITQSNEQIEEDEIIGEICLEDFADGDEEFDFLDNQSVDFGFEPTSASRMSRRPSLKLDSNKVRWIGNEKEFAAFFADMGLDDWFDVETEEEWTEFEVDEKIETEWRDAGMEHNRRCIGWMKIPSAVDIRDLIGEFEKRTDSD